MKKCFNQGVSLIEIVISVALVGILVFVLSNVPNSIKLVGSTQRESLAKDIAAKEVEQLRLQTYDNLSNGTLIISDSRLSSLPQSTATAIISDCPISVCSNSEQLKQAVITVSWSESNGVKKVQMTTFISNGGLR